MIWLGTGRMPDSSVQKKLRMLLWRVAWVMARDDNVVPIPGTKRRKYLEQNLGALDITLNDEELERLDKACPQGAAHGDRYTVRT